MNKLEKQLKKEINKMKIDNRVFDSIKKNCGIEKQKAKRMCFFSSFGSFFACGLLVLTLCLTLIERPENSLDLNTYMTVSFSSQVSAFDTEKEASPIFEIVLDEKDVVVKERGMNDKAVLILMETKPSTSLGNALEKIIVQASNLDYMTGSVLDVVAINASHDKEESVRSSVETALNSIMETQMLNFEYTINERQEDNRFGINPTLYALMLETQSKCGGKIEDYFNKTVDELLEMFVDYNKVALDKFELQVKNAIEIIEDQYSTVLEFYDQLTENCENYLEEIEDLIESYATGNSLSEIRYQMLLSQLKFFVTQNPSYFDWGADDLDSLLK